MFVRFKVNLGTRWILFSHGPETRFVSYQCALCVIMQSCRVILYVRWKMNQSERQFPAVSQPKLVSMIGKEKD
jgi:hypothetical protein